MSSTNSKSSTQQLALLPATSLVIGNMIGSGIFLLPTALAAYGGISIIGWIVSAISGIFLGIVFSKMSKMLPGRDGGPYAFSQAGLGDFAGFLVAWGYWLSVVCTNAAIAVAMVGYLKVFVPILNHNIYAFGAGLIAVWLLTWINTRGIREAGNVQLITTILKIAPLILVAIFGLFYIQPAHFTPFNLSETSNLGAIAATTTLTLFAFLGMESASIPASHVKHPEKNIAKATGYGLLITILIYILGSTVVLGIIEPSQLQTSSAPFADAAEKMWGTPGRYLVAIGAIISTFGALNGWILVQGQIPMAAAHDKLFPQVFARMNRKEVPALGIMIGSILVSLLMMMNYTKGLVGAFEFMILLATLTALIPYLFSVGSYALMTLIKPLSNNERAKTIFIATIAFIFTIWAVIGSGAEIVYWGFVALMMGIPLYVWLKSGRSTKES